MDRQLIFKSAIVGGFERQSVLNYINEIVLNAQVAQDRLNSRLEEVVAGREKLEQSIRLLEQRLSDAENVRETLNNELHSVKSKNSELASVLESLGSEIDRQKQIIREKDSEINRFSMEKSELEEKNLELAQKNAALQSRRDEIDKSTLHIGELMLKARMDAEAILEDAGAKAQEVEAQAGLRARELEDEAILKAQEVEESASLRARQMEEEADKVLGDVFDQFSEFRHELGMIEAKIEEAVSSMRARFAELGEAVSHGELRIRSFCHPTSNIVLAPQLEDEKDAEFEDDFFRGAAE